MLITVFAFLVCEAFTLLRPFVVVVVGGRLEADLARLDALFFQLREPILSCSDMISTLAARECSHLPSFESNLMARMLSALNSCLSWSWYVLMCRPSRYLVVSSDTQNGHG